MALLSGSLKSKDSDLHIVFKCAVEQAGDAPSQTTTCMYAVKCAGPDQGGGGGVGV